MKKQEKKEVKEIGVEMSSGAEKVERIEKVKSVENKKKAEDSRAQARVKKAQEKKKNKKTRLEKERALQERLLKKREEKARKRAHAKATRNQERQRRQKEGRPTGERRVQGYGGWLASVVALSFAVLVLGAMVTVGAVDMMKTKQGVTASCRATAYEFVGAMENMDDDLDRVRVSASTNQQSRILTDILVQARLAEADLEKMPIDGQANKNLTAFINKVAFESQRMLAKLRVGETLTDKDNATLEKLYSVSAGVRKELDSYLDKMTDKELSGYMKKGVGELAGVMERVENATLPENADDLASGGRNAELPKGEESESKIQPFKAEDLCARYFADYHINDFQCVGETVGRGYTAYNLQGYDTDGVMLFAEIDAKTGGLLRFNYYEDCNETNLDLTDAQSIAENFIEKMGYENMTAVKVRENGTDADFTFVYEQDGVAYYPDAVKVKICRTRGKVSAFDSVAYMKHHRERENPTFALTQTQAQAKLHDKLTVDSARAVVVNTPKGEKSAYEFLCSYGEERYVVYILGENGAELAVVNFRNLR